MALARARAAARRTKDRWKSKQWYDVVAPAAFNSKTLAQTFADDSAKLVGRRIESTMFDLSGDMKQMHIKLAFKVNEVVDNQARTTYIGHSMTSDYVRRLTRRGATKISAVFDLKTKDGSRIRVKPFAVTDRRSQTTQAQAIRQAIHDGMAASAEANSLSGFLADLLMGELTSNLYKEARKIHPIRRIEVAKVEVLKAPAIEVDETPIFKETSDEELPDEEPVAVELVDDSEDEEASAEPAADSEEE
jgi:small subunit ribosomal protein S3Ae